MEGRGFRDRAPEFEQAGAELIGISFDTPQDNKGFAEKNGFPFRLLSDVDRKIGEAYETKRAPAEQSPENAKRRTYLIDPHGTIVKSYRVTNISAHSDQVLADLRKLQEQAIA
jgi:peroxiredoxin Q/BCP